MPHSPKVLAALDALVNAITEEVTAPIQAAMAQVGEAFGKWGAPPHKKGKPAPQGPRILESLMVKPPFHVAGRRTAEHLEQQIAAVVQAVKKNPGQTVTTYSEVWGASPSELALPISRALEAKLITRKGQRKGTRYFPGKSGK